MSRKQKNKQQQERIADIDALLQKFPEPVSLQNIAKAARQLVVYRDMCDGTMVGWVPATLLVRMNMVTKTMTHLFAHVEAPDPSEHVQPVVTDEEKPAIITRPDFTG